MPGLLDAACCTGLICPGATVGAIGITVGVDIDNGSPGCDGLNVCTAGIACTIIGCGATCMVRYMPVCMFAFMVAGCGMLLLGMLSWSCITESTTPEAGEVC